MSLFDLALSSTTNTNEQNLILPPPIEINSISENSNDDKSSFSARQSSPTKGRRAPRFNIKLPSSLRAKFLEPYDEFLVHLLDLSDTVNVLPEVPIENLRAIKSSTINGNVRWTVWVSRDIRDRFQRRKNELAPDVTHGQFVELMIALKSLQETGHLPEELINPLPPPTGRVRRKSSVSRRSYVHRSPYEDPSDGSKSSRYPKEIEPRTAALYLRHRHSTDAEPETPLSAYSTFPPLPQDSSPFATTALPMTPEIITYPYPEDKFLEEMFSPIDGRFPQTNAFGMQPVMNVSEINHIPITPMVQQFDMMWLPIEGVPRAHPDPYAFTPDLYSAYPSEQSYHVPTPVGHQGPLFPHEYHTGYSQPEFMGDLLAPPPVPQPDSYNDPQILNGTQS